MVRPVRHRQQCIGGTGIVYAARTRVSWRSAVTNRLGSLSILDRSSEPSSDGPTASAAPGQRGSLAGLLAAGILLFCLALLPRAQNLGLYVTADEDLTLGRTGNFAAALAARRWEQTYQVGHPEVTTLWVASVALGQRWAREFAGGVRYDGRIEGVQRVTDRPGFMAALERARLALALVNSLLVVVSALLLWRLAGPPAGLLGGALLALEPFLVAHGQILRADAMVSELMLLAVLAAMAYWIRGAGLWALVLTVAATGLALLTKVPSVLVLPVILGVALVARRRLLAVPVWLLGTGAVCFALWPALWVQPIRTLRGVAEYAMIQNRAPTGVPRDTFSEAVTELGPLFDVAALLLRLSPLTILGVLALLWLRPRPYRVVGGVLLATAVVVGLAIALAPKKSDRYVLPLVPYLATLAGLGMAGVARRWRTSGLGVALALVVLFQAGSLLAVWPYWLTYYNPLTGGGTAASRSIFVGWGEGLDQVARALNRLPDASRRTAAVFYPDTLAAQFDGEAVPLDAYDVADFAVLYVASDQRRLTPPPLATALADRAPDLEVDLNGIRYAQVFRLDAPEFEGGILLDHIDRPIRAVGPGDPVRLNVRWVAGSSTDQDLRSRLTVLGADGGVAAESLGPLHARPGPAQLLEEQHRFRAPRRVGRYTVALALQTEPDGRLLALLRRPPGLEESPTHLIFRSLQLRISENPR
jgi:hypothetical protein